MSPTAPSPRGLRHDVSGYKNYRGWREAPRKRKEYHVLKPDLPRRGGCPQSGRGECYHATKEILLWKSRVCPVAPPKRMTLSPQVTIRLYRTPRSTNAKKLKPRRSDKNPADAVRAIVQIDFDLIRIMRIIITSEVLNMKLTYPACFYKDHETGAYALEVPDLPGCATGADNLAEAILMGIDAASGWILTELEEGRPIPPASAIDEVHPDQGGFVSLLPLDMDAYAEKYGDKAVRKNLTIPAWLNTFAESQSINFSKVLQDSLTEIYNSRN